MVPNILILILFFNDFSEVHFQLDNYLEWRNLLSDRVQIAKNKYSVLANECMRLRFDLIKKVT